MPDDLELLRPLWEPHPGQEAFLRSPAKFKVLACGRRWGKTDACAADVMLGVIGREASRTLLLAPTLSQALILFDRFVDLAHRGAESGLLPSPGKVKTTPHPLWKMGHHTVLARSGHLLRALRGMEATDIVVDEAAFVPEALVSEVAMPMLATTDGRLTLISTPNGRNHFFRFYQLGLRGEQGVWSATAPSSDNPLVSTGFLQTMRELISDRAYSVEYLARFEDSVGRVFRAESVEQCITDSPPPASGMVSIGVDWARYRDYTAVAVVQGDKSHGQLIRIEKFRGTSWSSAVDRVSEVVGHYPGAKVLCDSTGVGDVTLELLQASCPEHIVQGYTFTAASKTPLIDQLALMFDQNRLVMTPQPDLQRELEHFELAKGKLGAAAGFHDDLVIALALATHQLPRPYGATVRVVPGRRRS